MFPVDAFRSTVGKAVSLFRTLEIPFHLTGGITSIYYGEPRMTQDIDIVVGNDRLSAEVESFLRLLDSSDFIFDAESIRTAVTERGMFQLLDSIESLKLDIYARELIPGELQRSVLAEVFEGEHLPIASRIDSAVSKLVWISKGSHKSRRDFRQIYRLASSRPATRSDSDAVPAKPEHSAKTVLRSYRIAVTAQSSLTAYGR